MVATDSPQQDPTPVRIGDRLGDAYARLENRIRERAFDIFSGRKPEEGDPISDWMEAQYQLVSPVELAVKEQRKNIVVEGVFKGFAPQEIDIEVGDSELKVFGSHTETSTGKKGKPTSVSCETVHFYQAVPLPCAVEPGTSTARLLKNGKLKITLPRKTIN